MKRIKFTAILLSSIMMLSIASCSASDTKKSKTDDTSASVTEVMTKVIPQTEETTNIIVETTESVSEPEKGSVSGVKVKTAIEDFKPYETSADPFAPAEGEKFTIAYDIGTDYVPSENNTVVLPYIDRYTSDYWEIYGLVNEKGEILTPGIFAEIRRCGNVYILVRGEKTADDLWGDYTYGLINKDGSKYTGCIYQHCFYDGINVTFYNCSNGIVDLYTYNDDLEIISTKQLKYDSSIPCEYFQDLRFFMEDDKYCLCLDGTCYIFNGKTGEKLAEYPYYGQEGSIISGLTEKRFGYYYDIEVKIDEDCNISDQGELQFFLYEKIEDDLYYNRIDNRFVNGNCEEIPGLADHDNVIYIGDGYYLTDYYFVSKPGEAALLDMSDSLMCGAIGIFDDGSDNYYFLGDDSFNEWGGYHYHIPKSEFTISEGELWTESDTSFIYENSGVRAVVKSAEDPLITELARLKASSDLVVYDNSGAIKIWHLTTLDGFTADHDYENEYSIVTDKDGNTVFSRKITYEDR